MSNFDVISYILSKKYTDATAVGMGAVKGANCKIQSITDNTDGTHDMVFSWTDDDDVSYTSTLTVENGETPTMAVTTITDGHRVTFTTEEETISFDISDGETGEQGISVVSSTIDSNNYLTFTLSDGTTISAGQVIAVVTVDSVLSSSSSNPVSNSVITDALDEKVDKVSGMGLSTEDFTTTEKNKLSNIEDSAEVNVIESIIVNGEEVTITDKAIELTIITTATEALENYYLKDDTYTKTEVQDLIGSTVGVTISIVDELPETGETNIIYFVPTDTDGVYSQYIYTTDDGWVLIGSTTVDLSNYYTKTQVDTLLEDKQDTITVDSYPTSLSSNLVTSGGVYTAISAKQAQMQYSTMPTASADTLGTVVQYIGSTGTYTQDMFYRCVYNSDDAVYEWEEVSFSATVTVDSEIDSTSTNPVQNSTISEALDEKQDIIQYSTMPSAESNLGLIVQYIGTTTSAYTNGFFYKSVYDSDTDVYSWSQISLGTSLSVDSALSTISTNPVQNAVISTQIEDLDSRVSDVETVVDSLGTASAKDYTLYVRPNNHNLVESNAVYNAIASTVAAIYKPHGTLTCAELTSDLLVSTNVGYVYTMSDSGTTSDLFMQGEGTTINEGDTVSIVQAGEDETYIMFNYMGGMMDLSEYQTRTLDATLTIDGTEVTDVEDALSALNTLADSKQDELTFDTTPTSGSTNPVTSDGLYDIIGDTDISSIGDGTVTGAIDTLNTNLTDELGTVYTTDNVEGTYNASNTTIYTGCSLTLPSGTWIIKLGMQIGQSVAGYRQGACITTSNSTGTYSYDYDLKYMDATQSANQYYNVVTVVKITDSTTYYGMMYNGNVSTSVRTNMTAVKVGI